MENQYLKLKKKSLNEEVWKYTSKESNKVTNVKCFKKSNKVTYMLNDKYVLVIKYRPSTHNYNPENVMVNQSG